MSSHADDPKRNLLLNAMPQDVYARLRPHLESVLLPLGASLYESGSTMAHMYFPVDCIVSLLYVMENGSCAEIAIVGFEGLVGISLFMGGGSTPNRAVVQSSGSAYRLRSNQVQSEFENNFPFRHLMLRYTQALLTQTAQTAVCNRHHSIEQQLCRWLLLSFDRLGSDQLVMTQELIANMLGVRRESVTEAAGVLQKKDSSTMPVAILPWSTGGPWNRACANATEWSKQNISGCFLILFPPDSSSLYRSLLDGCRRAVIRSRTRALDPCVSRISQALRASVQILPGFSC